MTVEELEQELRCAVKKIVKLQIHRAARAEQREAATRYASVDEVLAERFVVEVAFASE